MKKLLTIIILLFTTLTFSQSYEYSYVEPCSGKTKSLTVPYGQSNIMVNYYGHTNTFTGNDFNNGVFQTWMNNISGTISDPCGSVAVILTNNVNMVVTQNIVSTVINISSVSNMMSDLLSDVGGGMSSNLSNALDNAENGGTKEEKKEDKNTSNVSNTNVSNNSTNQTGVSTSTGSNSQGSTSNQTGVSTPTGSNSQGTPTNNQVGTSTSSNGGTTQNNSNQTISNNSTSTSTSNNSSTTTSQNGSGSGSTSNAISNAEDNSKGETKDEPKNNSSSSSSGSTSATIADAEDNTSSGGGGKGNKSEKKTGSMIGSGDIVVMKSAEDPTAKNQFKFTTSITKANTDNTRVKGVLGNFTSVVNNTNITLYKAWVFKKSKLTFIAANSSMMNFDKDFFNTTTTIVSKRYKGNWKKLTTMTGLNYTMGKYGETKFMNVSAVLGGFYSYNINKKISGSVLIIGVYSPFTQFYDGRWWQSSTLIVPYSTWDYKITKTFKFNVSFSGVYEMNKSMLNYQVLTGGKIMF